MKRPLLPVALLYSGGILCGEFAHPPLRFLFAAAFVTATVALAFDRARPWLAGLLVVMTAWTGACWSAAILAPDDLRLQLGREAAETRLRGVLEARPRKGF